MSLLLRSALLVGSIFGARHAARMVGDIDVDDYLGRVGLARRPTVSEQILPAAGLIALGALVGAGTALMLAPSSGSALRARLSNGVDDVKNRLEELGEKGRTALENTHSNSTHSQHS